MKTIEVTDEMHKFLMNLSKELNTQDHRGTRMPYFFQIQESKETVTGEGMGESVWVCDGEICIRTEEDVKVAIFEYKGWSVDSEDDIEEYNCLDDFEKRDILKKNYQEFSVEITQTLSNAFFTAKACEEHIKANNYHYQQPVSYLNHAFRNPEMELVSKFLCELSGGKIHK